MDRPIPIGPDLQPDIGTGEVAGTLVNEFSAVEVFAEITPLQSEGPADVADARHFVGFHFDSEFG